MRTRTEYRPVRHTVNGDTETIDVPYEVPNPRDWDHIALTAATVGAALLVLAAVANATAGAGDLLARATPSAVAYSVAGAFDLVWIICMVLEWVARYDDDRARLPRRAGYAALAVAMAVLITHGAKEDSAAVGIATAAISALAKGTWTLVLRAHSHPLDRHTALWLKKRQARLGAQAALAAQMRHMQRIQDRTAIHARPDSDPDADPDGPDQTHDGPDGDPLPTLAGPVRVKDAVRTAVESGIRDPDAVLRYVRKVADANAGEETVNRYLRLCRKEAS